MEKALLGWISINLLLLFAYYMQCAMYLLIKGKPHPYDYITPLEVKFNNKFKFVIVKLLGYCPQHGWFKYPKRYRMNTSYQDYKSNFSIGCKKCRAESDEYWRNMWADYYSGIL